MCSLPSNKLQLFCAAYCEIGGGHTKVVAAQKWWPRKSGGRAKMSGGYTNTLVVLFVF
jgi:hypothetical protein